MILFLLLSITEAEWQSKRSRASCREFDKHQEGRISQPYHLHFNVSIFVVVLFLLLSITEADMDIVAVRK